MRIAERDGSVRESVTAQCPECTDGLADRIEKHDGDGRVVANFTCSTCGHEWTSELQSE